MISKIINYHHCNHLISNSKMKLNGLLFRSNYLINTQIIKAHNKQIAKARPSLLKQYPKTFQQKAVVLNDPRMIQAIEIIEFGVKYKPGKKYLFILLCLISAFTYLHQQILPERIIDGYFAVSTQMNHGFRSGYILSAFTYEKPFLLYLPLMGVIFQASKFIRAEHMALLVLANMITSGILGKYLVDERVKQNEVWDQERIFYGQSNLLSIGTGFWAMLGFSNGFNALKSRIMLKAIPGAGILRAGLPIGFILSSYIFYFIYCYINNKSKNSEVTGLCVLNSILWGLLMKRFKPFIVK